MGNRTYSDDDMEISDMTLFDSDTMSYKQVFIDEMTNKEQRMYKWFYDRGFIFTRIIFSRKSSVYSGRGGYLESTLMIDWYLGKEITFILIPNTPSLK